MRGNRFVGKNKKMNNREQTKEHLANFHIEGFSYYDGAEAFSELKMGTELSVSLDEDNKYDPRAVMLSHKDWKLGYVPREHNRVFYKLLKVGLDKNIKIRVQGLDKSGHPESQVRVAGHLVGGVKTVKQ